MNRTHQFSRAVDSPPVACLAEPDAHWCEVQQDQAEEGAHCRDQRDEQDTLDDDCSHKPQIRTRVVPRQFHMSQVVVAGPDARDATPWHENSTYFSMPMVYSAPDSELVQRARQ